MTATLSSSRSAHSVVVTAAGALDLSTAGRLSEVLGRACATGAQVVVLDLRSVVFMDCSALRPVLAARELMQSRSGDLVVRGISARCRRLLVLTGLTELLDETGELQACC